MIRRFARAALVALPMVLAHGLGACAGPQGPADELEVSRVVLYQSGVAYLERSGRVVGDELVMPIRSDQINDILATLVVVDHGASGSTSVSLPIDDDVADRLADLPPELRNAGGLVAVLHAFRGADVRVRAAARTYRGRVVGVENIDGAPHVSLLTGGDALVPLAIRDIDDVELENASLSMGLRRSLDHSLAEGDWKPTDVTVRFSRDGAHDVTMAYVVEQPIWKPAYRVVVEDGQLLLQGWAVIDNVSGADWNNVRLSLTAGAPISFRYDLHSPIFVDRPDMSGYGMPDIANLRPPTPTESAVARNRRADYGAMATSGAMSTGALGSAPGRAFADMEAADEDGDWMMGEAQVATRETYRGAAAPSAGGEQVGAMFRFDIPGRVTLPDQSSTMVTLVNADIAGEDALIYQPDSAPASHQHPYRAVMLDNTTAYPIQRAPIAIYQDGTFVGQGITPLIPQEESAVVPYALEQRVDITQRSSSDTGEVTLTRIIDGVIHTEVETRQGATFEVRNSVDRAHPLYLKVARYGGHELEANDDFEIEAVQREASYYLVPVDLEPGVAQNIRVVQTAHSQSSIDVFSPLAKRVFGAYLDRPDAWPDVADALAPVLEQLNELETVARQENEQRSLRNDVDRRSNELRANIRALGDSDANAELRRTLMGRLEEQDDESARIAGRLVELAERASRLRVEISEAMRSVSLR